MSFDVPEAMQHGLYSTLEQAGFVRSTKSQLPSEWKNDATGVRVEIQHVAKICHIRWGQEVSRNRLGKDANAHNQYHGTDKDGFIQWLQGIAHQIVNPEPSTSS